MASDPADVFPALEDRHPSLCSLDELAERYWNEVAPDMVAAGMDPDRERPTYEWLSANGHRDLIYALREYHDLSFGEFWTDTLGMETEDTDEWTWSAGDEATIDAVETYLERRAGEQWQPSTVRAHRTRLDAYLGAYAAVNSTEAVLEAVHPETAWPEHEAKDACSRAFEALDADYQRSTLEKIYRAVAAWYQHLTDRGLATVDPTVIVDSDFDWSTDNTETPRLSAAQIHQLYRAARNNEERLLIVALCGWGLRPNEVARLHVNQLALDEDDPHVAFEERKNGPSTVALIYGAHDAGVRMSLLKDDDWSGYLFPSPRGETPHIHVNTVRNRFQRLADRADFTVDGETPPPKYGRRYWYDAYSATLDDLLAEAAEIADEQGSRSGLVVWREYLDEERRRAMRREHLRRRLNDVFEADWRGGDGAEADAGGGQAR